MVDVNRFSTAILASYKAAFIVAKGFKILFGIAFH
jgi:hypothetical protein